MASRLNYHIQLLSLATMENIIASGGACFVAQAGLPDKQAITDKDGNALANPIQMTNGSVDFYIPDTVTAGVDLYIMTPAGHFVTRTGVKPSGPNEILVDTSARRQVMKIPFSAVDQGGDATETDTGFDVPATCFVLNRLHGFGLNVTVNQSGKTIDVGLGEVHPAESGGDANGFIAGSSIATAGLVTGTDGALFSTNAPHKSDVVTAKSITYTLSTGSTTAKGFILIPYTLV
jgi:hypothetical protein